MHFKILDMEQNSQVIFDKNSIEFVTVAAEYCAFIERVRGAERKVFVDTALKILPLLYLKASLDTAFDACLQCIRNFRHDLWSC